MIRPILRRPVAGWPLLSLFGGILALYLARVVLIPLALAITLAFILIPAVNVLKKLHIGRTPATLLIICVLIATTGFTGSIVANQLFGIIGELPNYRENILAKAAALRGPAQGTIRRAAQAVEDLTKEMTTAPSAPSGSRGKTSPAPMPVQIIENSGGWVYFRALVNPMLPPLEMTAAALIFTIFILIKREDLRNRLFRLAGVSRLSLMTEALDDAGRRISKYLLMQLGVNVLFGALLGLGLFLLGVPAATLCAVLAAFARFVPYLGILVAGAFPVLVSLAVFHGWLTAIIVFVMILALELVTSNLIEPWLYGAHTGISPLALLVTAAFWTMIWGWAGLILSTPLTVCLSVLGKHVPQLAFLHIILGDEDVLAPEAHLYQRLLAMDQEEARAIIEGFLADHSVTELYDQVIVPALNLAEHDRHKGKLDESREKFLFLAVREMLSDVEDQQPLAEMAENSTRQVICVPASDRADETAAGMLAHLLRQKGVRAIAPKLARLRSAARLSADSEDVICVSALPPFALTHAKEICARLRARYPRLKILVGLWGFSGDPERTAERFGRDRPDRLCTNLNDAVQAALSSIPAQEETPAPVSVQ